MCRVAIYAVMTLLLIACGDDDGTYESGLKPLRSVACPDQPKMVVGYIRPHYIKSRHDMPKYCPDNPDGQNRGCLISVPFHSHDIYALAGDFEALAHELDHLACGTTDHLL